MRRALFFAAWLISGICSSISFGATYDGGSGTTANPYQIRTPEQMNTIGANPGDWGSHFKLMNDIDMSAYTGTQYNIIGNSITQFTGTFDGDDHKIRNLTYTSAGTGNYVGLFGYIKNATITHLGNEQVNISVNGSYVGGLAGYVYSSSITDCYATGLIASCSYVGGLAGELRQGTITNCYSTGSVTSTTTSNTSCVGGLVGQMEYGVITYCHSTQSVTSISYSNSVFAGGLVGRQKDGSNISHSYSSGPIDATITLASMGELSAGGLVGQQLRAAISNCYSTSSVNSSCSGSSGVGGLVGQQYQGTVTYCYSMGSVALSSSHVLSCAGGLVGIQGWNNNYVAYSYSTGSVTFNGSDNKGGLVGCGGNVINSFWDIETSGLNISAGGHGRTTEQLKQASNYIGWNTPTETFWTINMNADYPRLAWENQSGVSLSTEILNDFIPGGGTLDDPYRISTPQQLNIVGLFAEEWSKVFRLENDIDLSVFAGTEFNRIGITKGKSFNGTFDGNNYVIHNLTYSTSAAADCVGLFGFTSDAAIMDLNLEDVNIYTGGSYAGSLAGFQKGGDIVHCTSSGGSVATYSAHSFAGGLVGYQGWGNIVYCTSANSVVSCSYSQFNYSCAGGLVAWQSGAISNCLSTGSVSSSAFVSHYSYAGGLVGEQNGTVTQCISTGWVSSSSQYFSYAGGLVGMCSGAVVDSVSIGPVSSVSSTAFVSAVAYAGGLAAFLENKNTAKIEKCYSTGQISANSSIVYEGGVLGYKNGTNGILTACFWDTETSEKNNGVGNIEPDPAGVTGKTTNEMKTLSTYMSAEWDFTNEAANGSDDIWRMCADGVDYPLLNWQSLDGDFQCPDGVNVEDLDYFVRKWLFNNCTSTNNFCGQSDMDLSGSVDLTDFAVFAQHWLQL